MESIILSSSLNPENDIDYHFHLFQYMEKHNMESRYDKTLGHELWDLSEFTKRSV